MGRDGGILKIKVHDTARPYPDLHILPLFSYFSGSLQPTSLFDGTKGPFPGPLCILDRWSYQRIIRQGERRRRRAAECPKDLQDHLFLLGPVYSFPLFSACKIALMLIESSVRTHFWCINQTIMETVFYQPQLVLVYFIICIPSSRQIGI